MIASKTKHTHDFTKLDFTREVGIDRYILSRVCDCGKSEAFECGTKDNMRQIYAKTTAQLAGRESKTAAQTLQS